MNLGLIKRRIKTENLINEDFTIGRKLKLSSLLYHKDITNRKYVKEIRKKIKNIIEIKMSNRYRSVCQVMINEDKAPLPTMIKQKDPIKCVLLY